jgi:hypothetical protein
MILDILGVSLLFGILLLPLATPKRRKSKTSIEQDAKEHSQYGVSEYGDICRLGNEKKEL